MYLRTVIILSLLLNNSCVQQKEHDEAVKKNTGAIEIYLFAKKPKSKEGISIQQAIDELTFGNLDEFFRYRDTSIMRYDIIKDQFLYAGRIDLPKQENIGELFIESSEIIGFDPSETDILVTKIAAQKIHNLPHSMFHGIPFVVCEDGAPIFTGYFWSTYSSFISTTFCVEYDHTQTNFSEINHYKMYKGNGFGSEQPRICEIENYPEIQRLTEAFKRDNKIINSDLYLPKAETKNPTLLKQLSLQ